MTIHATRRDFLKTAAASAAAVVIGFDAAGRVASAKEAAAAAPVTVNPFVALNADGTVTVFIKHFEMGQGVTTGLTTLVAEEIDADWSQMRIQFAPADNARYANLFFGSQGTGGSTAIANSFEQYRKAGAAARAVMVDAAARYFSVAPEAVALSEGRFSLTDGRTADFADVVAQAQPAAAPAEPTLKAAADFKLIGRADLPRYDSKAKTDGSAKFALDLRVPGMVTAVLARAPRFGGRHAAVDAVDAMKVRGVIAVKPSPVGVFVYAENTWAAIKGREALQIEWDFTDAENRSTDAIIAEHRAALDQPGASARADGDADAAIAAAGDAVVSADFVFPMLAHAPMETLNCIIAVEGDRAQIWDGCQFPGLTQPVVAQTLGLPVENVAIETVYAGGSFGRRATPNADYQVQAALAAQALGDGRPVHLVWTREDDVQGGFYRPLYAERIEATLGPDGKPVAWRHKLAGKSILIGTFFEQFLVKDGVDATSVEGANTLPYAIPNLSVDIRNMETEVPVLWWRAVGHTHTAYSTEVMIDLLAEAAGADPVQYRLDLLADHPRHAGALRLAAEKAGWGADVPAGHGRGVAVHESFSSFVATIVDVSADDGGAVKIDRVVVAVDCGLAINPDVIRAQMEGGVGFGLGAAMRNKITLTDGQVDQTNFWDYEPIRMSDMPRVEVHIVPSTEAPTGVGEPGVPPIGPALANAVAQALGQPRITEPPLSDHGVIFA